MDRIQLSQLAVVAVVAEHMSFRRAAQELSIAPSAVSHAVSALEASLGVRLLHRTTRSVSPTQEGHLLLERLAPALAEIDAALVSVAESSAHPSGLLRITMPRLAADDLVAPRIGDFLAKYPDVELDIATVDQFEDIVAKGFDAGFRLGENLDADMVAVKASSSWRGAIVGTPRYFEQFPVPLEPRDLMQHRCIRRRFSNGTIYRWELEMDGKALNVDVNGPLILPDQSLMRQAALNHAGLAFLFEHRVKEDIAAGRLVRVLEDWCPEFDGFYIYYPSRRQMRPALRAFVEFFRYRSDRLKTNPIADMPI